MKATNLRVTHEYLMRRDDDLKSRGYPTPKWIAFCRHFLDLGLRVRLYEARRSVSKYVTLERGKKARRKTFKVRFSNHRPIRFREEKGDCDFFVGVCNRQTTTTEQAIEAAMQFFDLEARDAA